MNFSILTNPSEVAADLLRMISVFTDSHPGVKLNQGLYMQVKVLSTAHYDDMVRRGLKEPLDEPVATGKVTQSIYKNSRCIFNPPPGYAGHPEAFLNKCLVLACVVGKYYNYSSTLEDHEKKMYRQKLMSKRNVDLYKEIEAKVNDLCSKHPNLSHGVKVSELPFAIECIAKELNCQIFLHHEAFPERPAISYPASPNAKLEWVNVLLSAEEEHIFVITRLATYYKTIGFTCPYCQKYFSNSTYRNRKHRCPPKTCKCCKRFILPPDSYENKETPQLWCSSVKDEAVTDYRCDNCNFSGFVNKECIANHPTVCSNSWQCLKCLQFTSSTSREDQADAKKKHVCGFIRCRFCKDNYEPSNAKHICTFLPPIPKSAISRLGVMSLSFYASERECQNCYECYPQKCKYHVTDIDSSLSNFGTLSIEQDQEKFSTYTSTSSDLWPDGNPERHTNENFPYLPSNAKLNYPLSEEVTTRFNQVAKVPNTFFHARDKFLAKKDKNCCEKLLVHLLKVDKFKERTILTDSYDTMDAVKKALKDNNFSVYTRHKHGKVVLLQITKIGLKFLPGPSFINKTFEDINRSMCKLDNVFFPTKINQPSFYNTTELPELDTFMSIHDSDEEIEEKRQFWENSNPEWHFYPNLKKYYMFRNRVLLKAFTSLLHESLLFLEDCHRHFYHVNKVSLVTPFTRNNSMAAYAFSCLRSFGFHHKKICSLSEVPKVIEASKGEMALAYHLSNSFPSTITNFSTKKTRLFHFNVCKPDMYNPKSKLAIFYEGCYFHGCNKCDAITKVENTPHYKSFVERHEKTVYNREQFTLRNAEVDKTVSIYGCEWHRAIKFNPDLAYLADIPFPELSKLNPRNAYKGSLCELYHMHYSQQDSSENVKMYKMDVSSMYGYLAATLNFPVGSYEELIDEDLTAIQYSDEEKAFVLKNQKVFAGMAYIYIVPPTNDLFPIIPYRNKSGQNVYTSCRSCYLQREKTCNHNDLERGFHATLCSNEINYCIGLGYRITQWFEAYQFASCDKLLASYFSFLLKKRTQYSGLGDQNESDYIDLLNASTPFNSRENPEMFCQGEISKNDAAKTLYKELLNLSIGCLGQNPLNSSATKDIYSRLKLLQVYDEATMIDFHELTATSIEVELKKKVAAKNYLNVNCFMPGFITAQSRIFIHQYLLKINAIGTVHLVNSDCIIFTCPEDKNPLPTSQFIPGTFKHELTDVVSFVALSPKFYSIIYKKNGLLQRESKISGVNMSNPVFSESLKHEEILKGLDKAFLEEAINFKVDQLRKVPKAKKFKRTELNFRDCMFTNRLLDSNALTGQTLPYGFKFEQNTTTFSHDSDLLANEGICEEERLQSEVISVDIVEDEECELLTEFLSDDEEC